MQSSYVPSLTDAFLRSHWNGEKPLLLGYSGGPDSKALLYALLECGVVPHIAHVDHGWRKESGEEASSIEEEAARLGCPFFSTRLSLEDHSEEAARRGRFSFFSSLFPGYEALLLAHQAEDLAETVLKRLFEGAHLCHLSGMEPVSQQHGVPIWRPFLPIRRSEILQFLDERKLYPLVDSSNSDPVYLRVRMRSEIFPFLSRCFGKEIVENLTLLSARTAELKKYLDRQVARSPLQRGPWGILADLNGMERFEQIHLLLSLAREESVVLNRDHLETLLSWINMGAKSKYLTLKTKKIFVDEARVWFFSSSPTA
ncbi:MAG: tRNA lysidine(34) synthetase TilS [Chlamydiales bacterium]